MKYYHSTVNICKCVGTGIQVGLKIPCPVGIKGSIPFTCTKGKTYTCPGLVAEKMALGW